MFWMPGCTLWKRLEGQFAKEELSLLEGGATIAMHWWATKPIFEISPWAPEDQTFGHYISRFIVSTKPLWILTEIFLRVCLRASPNPSYSWLVKMSALEGRQLLFSVCQSTVIHRPTFFWALYSQWRRRKSRIIDCHCHWGGRGVVKSNLNPHFLLKLFWWINAKSNCSWKHWTPEAEVVHKFVLGIIVCVTWSWTYDTYTDWILHIGQLCQMAHCKQALVACVVTQQCGI